MRNPRRCYDAQGREVAPETVGGLLAAGIGRAEVWCNGCHHHAEVAIDRFPGNTPVPDLCLRFQCSVCSGRNLSSRPSVMDHYAVLRERTGMGHGNALIGRRVEPLGGPAMPMTVIATVEEYEDATRRIADLAGCIEGSPEETELKALIAAVEKWDFDHDDATAWR